MPALTDFQEDNHDILTEFSMSAAEASFPATHSDPDTMTLEEVLQQPDWEQFVEAMHKELKSIHREVIGLLYQLPRFQVTTSLL